MTEMKYLSEKEYTDNAVSNMGVHWKSHRGRWHYHRWAVERVKELNLTEPSSVLEIGSAGACIVKGSDTLDYSKHWNMKTWQPKFDWDVKDIPWPFKDNEYNLIISLRVWQHLGDLQEAAFREARRVSTRLILAIPVKYTNGYGVTLEQLIEWNDGVEPDKHEVSGGTGMYLWTK